MRRGGGRGKEGGKGGGKGLRGLGWKKGSREGEGKGVTGGLGSCGGRVWGRVKVGVGEMGEERRRRRIVLR